MADLTNAQIAAAFDELGDLYELDGAVAYRVIAYRTAAKTVRETTVSVVQMARDGRVTELNGVGKILEEKILALDETGDIPTAKRFYVDTLGFETTFEYGTQALFVSAGGYHHHVGMNTWHSSGAGTRTPALGLGQVSIEVPSADDVGALREHLASASVPVADDGSRLVFDDPWANLVTVHTPS